MCNAGKPRDNIAVRESGVMPLMRLCAGPVAVPVSGHILPEKRAFAGNANTKSRRRSTARRKNTEEFGSQKYAARNTPPPQKKRRRKEQKN